MFIVVKGSIRPRHKPFVNDKWTPFSWERFFDHHGDQHWIADVRVKIR
jgi:hypothetical protein